KGFFDKTLKAPLDLGDYEFVTVRARAGALPKGRFSFGFSEGQGGNYVEVAIKIDSDGKWHEVKANVADLGRTGTPDTSKLTHAVFHYTGNDPVDVELDEVLLAKKK